MGLVSHSFATDLIDAILSKLVNNSSHFTCNDQRQVGNILSTQNACCMQVVQFSETWCPPLASGHSSESNQKQQKKFHVIVASSTRRDVTTMPPNSPLPSLPSRSTSRLSEATLTCHETSFDETDVSSQTVVVSANHEDDLLDSDHYLSDISCDNLQLIQCFSSFPY